MPEQDFSTKTKEYYLDQPQECDRYFLKGSANYDWGMKNRLARIFSPDSGNTVMLAFDHGYFQGPTTGLERVDVTIRPLAPWADALMCTRGVLRSLIFLPAALGVTINGILWLLIFSPSQGPAASFLGLFHTSSAFFGSATIALTLVIFVQIWANIGFTALIYLASMDNIPPDLFEAARMDGAGRWSLFRDVTYPLISSAMTVNVLLAAVGSMNVYDIIYVLTDGTSNTATLGMYMFNTSFEGSGDLGLGAAVAVMMFLLTLIVAVPLQWLLRRREVHV